MDHKMHNETHLRSFISKEWGKERVGCTHWLERNMERACGRCVYFLKVIWHICIDYMSMLHMRIDYVGCKALESPGNWPEC